MTVIESARAGAIPLAWSPGRDRLLFAQWDRQTLQLFRISSETRRSCLSSPQGPTITHRAATGRMAGWSQRLRAGRNQVERGWGEPGRSWSRKSRMLGPGDAVEWLSLGPMDGEPTCSPDGTRNVAYVRLLSGRSHSEIWIHVIGGEEPARSLLRRAANRLFLQTGSGSSTVRSSGKTPALWRIRRDGTGRTRIGRGSGAEEYGPAVSPDGSLVVYESVSGNRYRLFVRRFDGTGDRVLFSDGDGTYVVW